MKKRILVIIFALVDLVGIALLLFLVPVGQSNPRGFDFSYGSPFHWCFYYDGGRIACNTAALFADIAIWVNVFGIIFAFIYIIAMITAKKIDDDE